MKYLVRKSKGKLEVREGFLKRVRLKESQMKILVIDTALALDHCLRFVEDGHLVYLYQANLSAYPKLEDQITGDGFDSIMLVEDFAEVLDEIDFVYITDSCFPDLALFLREKGKVVYGPTKELVRWENDRVYFWEKAKEAGLDVPDGEVVKGVEEARKYIREHEGERLWVKISKFRGNLETFSVVNEDEFNAMISQAGFGPYLNDIELVIQHECEGIEIGCDGWICSNGLFRPYFYTIEEKGRGNVVVVVEESGFDEYFYDKVMDVVRDTDYRCNLSVEGFWDGERFRVLEITPRNPYPVSSLYPRFVENFTEVVYGCALNKVIDVKVDWDNPYLVELTISTDEKDLWRVIEFDERYNVGFRRAVYKGDQVWFVPGDGVVATVNTKGAKVEGALEKAKKIADSVKCMFSQYDGTFVDSVLEKIKKLDNWGEEFRFTRY